MKVVVRKMRVADKMAWAQMRYALWPDQAMEAHAGEIDGLLKSRDDWCFIAETVDGQPIGFAEVSLRKFANGCETRPVPFLEGIWVEGPSRRQDVGGSLIRHVESFLVSRGFREIGSDTYIDNRDSHIAHRGWGFLETERVIYFRKPLNAPKT
jgi:aminoglycoside 6'-N-acetyltransferase I